MIITDSTDTGEMHIWVHCTCDQTLADGRAVQRGRRYFVLWAWDHSSCGQCTDHPNCEAGALEFAGLHREEVPSEMFCAADFERVSEAETAELMQAMLDVGEAFAKAAAA